MPGGHFIDESTKMTNYQKKVKITCKKRAQAQTTKMLSTSAHYFGNLPWRGEHPRSGPLLISGHKRPILFFPFLHHGARLNPVGRGPLLCESVMTTLPYTPYYMRPQAPCLSYIRETSPTIYSVAIDILTAPHHQYT